MKFITTQKRKCVNFWSSGFTLIESLLGLSVFCLLASLLPLLFQVFSGVDQANSRLQLMQWEVFSSQIKKEIRMVQRIDTQSNRLLLTKDSDSIIYERYGTNIRRRVNFTGNEILLQNINNIRFEPIRNGVTIIVEDIWGKNYSFAARSYINLSN